MIHIAVNIAMNTLNRRINACHVIKVIAVKNATHMLKLALTVVTKIISASHPRSNFQT